ncbi:hypothetical protein TNCV_4020081 [Trichonephila clavipes]|nr:hypothetical protein TNCV_4020081 [Trichonephila clavipes]
MLPKVGMPGKDFWRRPGPTQGCQAIEEEEFQKVARKADFNLGKRKKSSGAKKNQVNKGGGIKCHNSIRGQELPYNQGSVWPGIIVQKSPGASLRELRANAMDPLQ